ncbi:MAG: aminotransferase class I/II-fold pyridoxal phosphate-dependent enzyme, partial [Phyllobacteriaceae bacterium]|nr:aminotransferase class I/II-fold pyridoxal phosphate-dependent enzyme [Phyllobacteriaceae bacterium]
GNYDYLGLSHHPSVRTAAIEAIREHGTGVNGSRLVGGERAFHTAFEADLANFVGTDAALTLVSGYLTNLTLVPHLLGGDDLLVVDEYAHNSIMMGARSAKATVRSFRHNDLDHLDHLLAEARGAHRNCLIAVESLYSMDGDWVDLPRLLALRDRHRAWVMIDEAHSFGVLGDRGRGITEHFGEDPRRVDLIVGTLSKTLAGSGGFVCAHRAAIDLLRFTLPGFVYSVGLSPAVVAGAHAALKLLIDEPHRVARLRAVSEGFLARARAAGLNTGAANGRAIVPILFPDFPTTLAKAAALLAEGIYAPPVVQVGVPQDAPRIRFFLSADHTDADLDRTVRILAAPLDAAAATACEPCTA